MPAAKSKRRKVGRPTKSEKQAAPFPESGVSERNREMVGGWKSRIERRMKLKNLSQRALSERAGLGASTVRYMLAMADTTTLDVLERIANATDTSIGYLITGSATDIVNESERHPSQVRLLPVALPDREPGEEISGEHGVVSVCNLGSAQTNELHALRINDRAMEAIGRNVETAIESIVVPDDIVIWDADMKPSPGKLCVARISIAGSVQLAVRSLELNEDGEPMLVANNAAFGRNKVKYDDILGGVRLIMRRAD
jgi:transcriptional regulator with XRE-family HTH domain